MTNCESTQCFLGHIIIYRWLDGILIIRVKIKLSLVSDLSLAERLHGGRIILVLASSHHSDRRIKYMYKPKAKNISCMLASSHQVYKS